MNISYKDYKLTKGDYFNDIKTIYIMAAANVNVLEFNTRVNSNNQTIAQTNFITSLPHNTDQRE